MEQEAIKALNRIARALERLADAQQQIADQGEPLDEDDESPVHASLSDR